MEGCRPATAGQQKWLTLEPRLNSIVKPLGAVRHIVHRVYRGDSLDDCISTHPASCAAHAVELVARGGAAAMQLATRVRISQRDVAQRGWHRRRPARSRGAVHPLQPGRAQFRCGGLAFRCGRRGARTVLGTCERAIGTHTRALARARAHAHHHYTHSRMARPHRDDTETVTVRPGRRRATQDPIWGALFLLLRAFSVAVTLFMLFCCLCCLCNKLARH